MIYTKRRYEKLQNKVYEIMKKYFCYKKLDQNICYTNVSRGLFKLG